MATKRFVDTNILLRYVLRDDKRLYQDAKHELESSTENSLILTAVIVAEVVYILRQNHYERPDIAKSVLFLLSLPSIYTEDSEAVTAAVKLLATRKLDFADCYILERSVSRGLQLVTQDKKLKNARKVRDK